MPAQEAPTHKQQHSVYATFKTPAQQNFEQSELLDTGKVGRAQVGRMQNSVASVRKSVAQEKPRRGGVSFMTAIAVDYTSHQFRIWRGLSRLRTAPESYPQAVRGDR